jgi:hypothetical protein
MCSRVWTFFCIMFYICYYSLLSISTYVCVLLCTWAHRPVQTPTVRTRSEIGVLVVRKCTYATKAKFVSVILQDSPSRVMFDHERLWAQRHGSRSVKRPLPRSRCNEPRRCRILALHITLVLRVRGYTPLTPASVQYCQCGAGNSTT